MKRISGRRLFESLSPDVIVLEKEVKEIPIPDTIIEPVTPSPKSKDTSYACAKCGFPKQLETSDFFTLVDFRTVREFGKRLHAVWEAEVEK